MKNRYYVSRWRKILDTIIEKGKGPILGKLRTIQLIEADLQLLMRIFFGIRCDGIIEKDERISKYNFGTRKGYSIENAILEKRLLIESNLFDQDQFVYTISDLEACYDRQLPNILCMAMESVGAARNPCIVFSKLIPKFEH